MKRLKFVLTLLVAEACLLMAQSCNDCGKDTVSVKMKMNGITALAGRITATTVNSYGTASYKIDTLKTVPRIRYDSLFFLIGNELERIAYRPAEPQGGNSAFACDPVVGFEWPYVIEMSIVSDQDYIDGYPKGTNLKRLFKVQDYIDTSDSFNATDLGAKYRFNYAPKKPGKHTFTVTYKIQEGGEFTAVLKDINLY